MAKLIICIGIPASGKSTWAAQYAQDNPDTVVVTRDDIREEYGAVGGGWSKEKEFYVVKEMERRIREGLMSGKTVISADTNLNPRVRQLLADIASKCGAISEDKPFPTDVETCIERDSKREGHRKVGADRIREYDKQFTMQFY